MEKLQHFSPHHETEAPEGTPGARLISAIFVRALADYFYGDDVLKKNAGHFFYSDDFSYYCSLLYGTSCASEVEGIRHRMIGEGVKKLGKHGRSGRKS